MNGQSAGTEHKPGGYTRGCRCAKCVEARKEITRRYREKTREKRAAYNKEWYEANRERQAKTQAVWLTNNRDKARAKHKRWRDKNADAERERSRQWFESHPEYYDEYRKSPRGRGLRAAVLAERRAKLKAIPLSAEDKALVKLIYSCCPVGYEVDHVIPVTKGGAHAPSNLQYLPSSENKRKSARVGYVARGAIRWQDVLPSTTIPVTGVGPSGPKRTAPLQKRVMI